MVTTTGITVQRTLLNGIAGVAIITLAACGSDGRPASPTAPSTATVAAVVVTGGSTAAASFQLTATARMSDGTARDVTSSAAWESSNPVIAAVSSTGMVTVVGSGELDVRATYQNVTGSMHLSVARHVVAVTVTGAPSTSSSPFQLIATARGSDGSSQDVTRSATWESSNAQLASVSAGGYVTILGNGDVDLRAIYQGVMGAVQVHVSLPRTFTMGGTVAEAAPNVRQIAGARVQIIGGGHTFSDDRGAFAITGLPAGRTMVEFSKDGYQTFENEVVLGNSDTQLTVNLYPTPPKGADGTSATARCNDGSWSWAQTRTDACAANGGMAYAVCPGPLCTP
jgi:Carboxypeptidase regulatory-like domain/Bacterial Ig-like domain (group 2)